MLEALASGFLENLNKLLLVLGLKDYAKCNYLCGLDGAAQCHVCSTQENVLELEVILEEYLWILIIVSKSV